MSTRNYFRGQNHYPVFKLVHVLLYDIFVRCFGVIARQFGMKILFTFLTEKIPVLDQQEVCLSDFHQQTIVMSSQNNMRKYHTKWHEQVFSHALGRKISRHTLKIGPQITPKRPPPKCTGTASRGSSIRAFISNLDFFEKEK